MASPLGSIFSSLGESLPRMSKAFTDEEERRREREIALERLAQMRATNEDQNYEREQRNLGDQRYSEYSSDMGALSELGGTPESVLSQMDAGPLQAQQQGKVQKLYRLSQQKPMEQMQSYDLPKLAGFNKGVGSAVNTQLAADRMDATGDGSEPGVWGAKKQEWNEDPVRAKGNFNKKVDILLSKNTITPEEAAMWRSEVEVRPIDASIGVDQLLIKPGVAAATITAQTPAKVEQKYALVAPEAATAGATTTARTVAENITKQGIPGSFEQNKYTAANYANRIKQSEDGLSKLFESGFKPEAWYNKIKSPDALNAIKDPNQQMYAQAMRNFINATLRRESGAAIAESEYTNANKQYFPMLNDSPEVLAQKAENRMRVFDAFKVEAGGAYDQVIQEGAKRRESGSGIKQIKTDADYEKLPSGTEFIDPTGKRRRKP